LFDSGFYKDAAPDGATAETSRRAHNSPRTALANSAGVNDANSVAAAPLQALQCVQLPAQRIQPGNDGAWLAAWRREES
jgi:hypothetical protein